MKNKVSKKQGFLVSIIWMKKPLFMSKMMNKSPDFHGFVAFLLSGILEILTFKKNRIIKGLINVVLDSQIGI